MKRLVTISSRPRFWPSSTSCLVGNDVTNGKDKTVEDIRHAKKDGTQYLLEVRGGEHPMQDAKIWTTIGHNNFDNDGEDIWRFAGWCWSHDHYTQGSGEVLGFEELEKVLDLATAETDDVYRSHSFNIPGVT